MAAQENTMTFNKDAWIKEVHDAVQKQADEKNADGQIEEEKEIAPQTSTASEPTIVESEEATETPQPYDPSDSDLRAMQLGWRPEHLFKGDKSKWKPSEEWLAYKPAEETFSLKKKNAVLEQKTYFLEQELEKLKQHILESSEKKLLQQKRERIELGEAEEVDATEKELAELYDKFHSAPKSLETFIPPEVKEHVDKTAQDFVSRNNHWFNNESNPDARMATKMARDLDKEYFQWGVTDPETHFEFVEAVLRKKFPDLHIGGLERKTYSSKVMPPRASAPQDRKRIFTESDLNEQQKFVMKGLIRNGHMTVKQYIDYLVKEGELR